MADQVIPDPTSLDVATDNELIDELGRRCVGLVVAMSKPPKDRQYSCEEQIMHRGNWHAVVGLAKAAHFHFHRQVRKNDGA